MVILDKGGNVVDSPDYDSGRVEYEQMLVTHHYVVDTEEKGHWETIAEYPETGGKDVEWCIDEQEVGHWETLDGNGKPVEHYDGIVPEGMSHDCDVPDVWHFGRYIEYTPEELEQIEAAKRESEEAAAQVAAIPDRINSIDDQLTNIQLALVGLYEGNL